MGCKKAKITHFGMRGLACRFRMWVIQGIYRLFGFVLRGLSIKIENGIIYPHSPVSEHEKAIKNIMTKPYEVQKLKRRVSNQSTPDFGPLPEKYR